MRLLTWNILHGGGPARTPEIALTLLEHGPDIAVITEFRATTGGQIAGVLADHGLAFQVSTAPPTRSARPPGPRRQRNGHANPATAANGVLIASRFPLEPAASLPAPPALSLKWAAVRIGDPALMLAAVHLPDDSRPGDKAAGWHHLLAFARAHREAPCAIVGDFNTGRHRQDEPGATFGATDLLGTLWTLGFRDAWRHLHPGDRQYTWFSHAGNGFRIDHAFLSPALTARLTAARYSHAERELRLSDHSALLVDLA